MVMPSKVQEFMESYQQHGVCFALDDFGSGYTALRYLKAFHFDILKIDGQFINDVHKNPDNLALTKAIISIARHFDMFTVAEHVENELDAAILTEIGADCLQGYLFGAPTVRPYWQQKRDAPLRTG